MAEPARDLFAAPDTNTTTEFYTVRQVAEIFKVTPVTVRNWISEGKLDYIKINTRFRITRASVLKLAQFKFGG